MNRPPVLLGLALLIACRTSADEREAPTRAAPPSSGSSVPSAPVDGAGADAPTLRAHMDDHFAAAARIERAVVRSDLDQARVEATYLAEHTEHAAVADWAPYVEAMRAGALHVKEAPDLTMAAGAAAVLGMHCSRCHTDHSAIVAFPWEAPPPADGTSATRMRRHQWAAARMWEGLIAPSQTLWTEGASMLAGADLDSLVGDRLIRDHDARDLLARVRALAARAPAADSSEARTVLYGELLTTCAACHQLARDPAPPASP